MDRLLSSLDYIFHTLTRVQTVTSILGVTAVLSWVAVFASADTGELQVHFLDVDQGDAIFIEFPDGRQILIDGGPNDKVVEKLEAVMPFWDRSIDMVIGTHADADHISGLVPVFAHYDVDTIFWNGVPAATEIFKAWQEAVLKEGAEVLVGEYGMRVVLSKTAFFEIVYPLDLSALAFASPWPKTTPRPLEAQRSEGGGGRSKDSARPDTWGGVRKGGQNNSSLVIRFVYGDDTFLFTGDIERQAEYEILSQNLRLDSDVLKVAHHGSKTSSSELFLERVSPKIAVILSGRSNPYGHPHEIILQRLKEYGIKVRRTSEEGDITLTSNGNSF